MNGLLRGLQAPTRAVLRPLPWRGLSLAIWFATVVSTLQIGLRRHLAGETVLWLPLWAQNALAWLPWLPLGGVAFYAGSRWPSVLRVGLRRRSGGGSAPPAALGRELAVHVGLALACTAGFLVYLSLFRLAFFPEVAGPATPSGLLLGLLRETSDFFLTCLALYGLVAVLGALLTGRAAVSAGSSPIGAGRSADSEATRGSADHRPPPAPIAVRRGTVTVLVEPAEIVYVTSDGSYCRLHTATRGCLLLRGSLKSLAERLADLGFRRIHRSTLVPLDRVREIRALRRGDARVRLWAGPSGSTESPDDPTVEVRLSRRFRQGLADLLPTAAESD